jgi:hypothetical protein
MLPLFHRLPELRILVLEPSVDDLQPRHLLIGELQLASVLEDRCDR